MRQILHIFKKDTRRFWMEILASSVIMCAYVWIFPNKWKVFHDQSLWFRLSSFIGILSFLVPVGWWLLTARVVHAETLVGNEQFWITRPYEWPKLLAAKVLFLAVWLGGPYLLAQSWLLAVAGYHPWMYIPGLLHCLLAAAVVFVLPMLAVAAVTSSFARLALTTLGGYVAYLGFNFWSSLPRDYVPSHPFENKALPILLIAGCMAVVVLQYARRRASVARAILLAVAILIPISVLLYSRASLVDRAYPAAAAGAGAPMNISFAPTLTHPGNTRTWDGQDHIYLPVLYTGVGDGYAVFEDDTKFTITAADGRQWSSSWQAATQPILPDQGGRTLELKIRPEVYDRFKGGPVTLHITLAVTRYQKDSEKEMAYPAADAAIPGVGFCTPQSYQMPNLHCRAAIHGPRLTYMTAMWSKVGCSDPNHLFEPTAKGSAWIGPSGFEPLTAVWTSNLFMGPRLTDAEQRENLPWQICPGSPLTVATYHWAGVGRTDLTLPNFMLPPDIRME